MRICRHGIFYRVTADLCDDFSQAESYVCRIGTSVFNCMIVLCALRIYGVVSAVGFVMSPSWSDIVFILIGMIAHHLIGPFFSYMSVEFMRSTKPYNTFFKPLPKLVFLGAHKYVLTAIELKALESSLTKFVEPKLQEVLSSVDNVTAYDAVNLLLLDYQFGIPMQSTEELQNTKKEIQK